MQFFCLIHLLLLNTKTVYAQTDFQKYRQQQQETFDKAKQQREKTFADYQQTNREKIRNHRDSLNRAFADFLDKEWKRFDLLKPEQPINEPISVPPVYDATKSQPPTRELPLVERPIKLVHVSVTPLPSPTFVPVPEFVTGTDSILQERNRVVFFGTHIGLKEMDMATLHLSGVEEKNIATYWKSLISIPYPDIMSEIIQVQMELGLNDWGIYQLLGKVFEVYFPYGTVNEQVVFTIFMLNQFGYQAKIGKSGQELVPLVVFSNNVTNCMYFSYGDKVALRYYLLNPQHKEYSYVQTCTVDYTDAMNSMDLRIASPPLLAKSAVTKSFELNNKTYLLKHNSNIVDFYRDYPCMDFSLYVEAPLDEIALQSIELIIGSEIIHKSQEEAVNWLLHFVQNAFEYKTDNDQFGYEKFFFAEETLASSFSDCEDRSILFAQLVRHLLKMPVVLIYYPGIHLATAVRFNNPDIEGDYVLVDGIKYIICDPTYINADLGMGMPDLNYLPVEVFKLR